MQMRGGRMPGNNKPVRRVLNLGGIKPTRVEPRGIARPELIRPAKGNKWAGHTPGQMNALEREYAELLGEQLRAGEIKSYVFEAVTLTLARPQSARPVTWRADFLVLDRDDTLIFDDVKGGLEAEAQRAKIRLASAQFPYFRFRVWRKVKGVWQCELI